MNFMNNIKRKGKADILTLIVFVVFFIVLYFYQSFTSSVDFNLQDFWQNTRIRINRIPILKNSFMGKLFPVKKFNENVVLVTIEDSPSLIGISGILQDDRRIYAQALENLYNLNPKVVGLEFYFPYGDKNDPLIPIAKKFNEKLVIKSSKHQYNDKKTEKKSPAPPFPELLKAIDPNEKDEGYGFTYFKNYRDEAIRSVSLFIHTYGEDKYRYSFQTLLWAKFLDLKLKENNSDVEPDLNFENGYMSLKGEKLARIYDSECMLLNYNKNVNFIGGMNYPISFYDLYKGKVPKHRIEGKIVIIAPTHSMVDEKYYSPIKPIKKDKENKLFDEKIYPAQLNVMVLNNLLEKSFLKPTSEYIPIIASLLILFSLFLVFSYVSPSVALIVTSLINIFLLAVSLIALMQYDTQIEVVSPIFATTFAFVFMVGKKYYIEFSEKRHIKTAFQHYVTASVVNEILKDPSKLNLHGEERILSVFFSDIEGFTTLAEGLSPIETVNLLNEYLTAMTNIIFEYDGLLDKYEGDAIMAVFGAPVNQSDHAIRACQCALKNQKVLNELREKWRKEGKPEIRIRIGVNTGVVVVGNMGSTMRFDYTVIGDNVNLASRLEIANKMFNTSILVSDTTAKLAEQTIVSRKIARFKALGKSTYTDVYELLADKDSDSSAVIAAAYKSKEIYENADNLVMNRDFEGAEKILGAYLRENEKDLAAKALYNKVKGYLLVPPPADWQNIVNQDEK